MNLFEEIRARRVPQYLSAYLVGSWGLVQFVTFLEDRMQFSPHLVNLIGLTLILFLPSIIILAWCHGRPGSESWHRSEKIGIPLNLFMALALLVVLFHDKELGAVTETVQVQDEHGAVTERVVPKSDFRKRVIVYYADDATGATDDWLPITVPMLLRVDLNQDAFVQSRTVQEFLGPLRTAGYEEGFGLPRALQRKIARDAHYPHFLTWSWRREAELVTIDTELHDSVRGKVLAEHSYTGDDVLTLVDQMSRQLREDLGIPSSHIDAHEDMPVAELVSDDPEAIAGFMQAAYALAHHNDWEAAIPLLETAVAKDPSFTIAQYQLSTTYMVLGNAAGAQQAVEAAMAHLYRLPERLQLAIKSIYYINVERDPDKTMAVVDMWIQLYPEDADAYQQKALFHMIRSEIPEAIAAYQEVLRFDPHRYEMLQEIGKLYQGVGDFDQAEAHLRRYAERFPKSVQGWSALADLYEEYGRFADATAALERIELLEPGRLDTRLELTAIAVKEGRFDAAATEFDQALAGAASPHEQVQVYEAYMVLLRTQGRIDAMLEQVQAWREAAAVAYNPVEMNMLHSTFFEFLVPAGRAVEALDGLAQLKTQVPSPLDDMISYGDIVALADLGRYDEAHQTYTQLETMIDQLKLEVWRSRLALVLGRLSEAEGDLEAAIAHLQKASDLDVTKQYTLRALGRCLRKLGRHDDAGRRLTRALELFPAEPETNLEMALLLRETGDLVRAREHLERALTAWAAADPGYRPAALAETLRGELEHTP